MVLERLLNRVKPPQIPQVQISREPQLGPPVSYSGAREIGLRPGKCAAAGPMQFRIRPARGFLEGQLLLLQVLASPDSDNKA